MQSRLVTVAVVASCVLAALPSRAVGQCQTTELDKLVSSDAATSDEFGASVGIDGNLAVIGAEGDDDNGSNSGAAYIYERDPSTGQWTEVAKLTPNDGASFDEFGTAVAISGDRVIVGANQKGDFDDNGVAYVFRRDPVTHDWSQEQKLSASDATVRDEFGIWVDIDGETLVVGAYRDDAVCPKDINCDSGAVYVFEYNPVTVRWEETQKLTHSDGERLDGFGRTVVLDGDLLLASCQYDDDVCPEDKFCDSGAVYAFVRDPDTRQWAETEKITPSDAAEGDQFGFSIDLDGEYAIIGSVLDDDAALDAGAAYVFTHNNGSDWIELIQLTAFDAHQVDWFGYDVALRGDFAVVGNISPSVFGGSGTSDAYVYQRSGPVQWVHVATMSPSDVGVDDQFGYSIDLSDTAVMLGSLDDDHDAGQNAGSAYFFEGLSDCDGSKSLDLCDIASGAAMDANGNGIPDVCECPGDFDGSGGVDAGDLALLLGNWGNPGCGGAPECPADLNGDGVVDPADLAQLLGNWGPCQPAG